MLYCGSLASSLAKADANWDLQSDTAFSYSLNCLKTLLKKRLAIPVASAILVQEVRITPL